MRVLDLFSGLGGWSNVWRENGHEVLTVDLDPQFEADLVMDVMQLRKRDLPWSTVDVVLASPPCEAFSVASIGTHWGGGRRGYVPKTRWATMSMRLVMRTFTIAERLSASHVVVENPRGVLRKLELVPEGYNHTTQWYCHWGEQRAKPTDLWYRLPPVVRWRAACHNQQPHHPELCCCRDHNAAVRGSRTGTQGFGSAAKKSLIPPELANAVYRAIIH